MGDILKLQESHAKWLEHNFPNQRPEDGLLGLVEEVGELAHAHLKHSQGIRQYDQSKYQEEAKDAIGDIFVYLMSYCTTNNFNLEEAIHETWYGIVNKRDWQADPAKGVSA